MPLINQAIPSLFNGVSQQPAQLRQPSQCELIENFYPTVASGLMKRPPTRFLAKLSSAATGEAAAHVINRDSTERYVVVLMNGDLEVFDAATGAKKTVNFPSGKGYLTSTSPRRDFAAVTVADHTFIVNRAKVVAMGAASAPGNPNVGYVVFTHYGAGVQRGMAIYVDGVVKASYSGADANITTVINSLQSQLSTNLGAGWSVTKPFYNIIRIERTGSSADWILSCTDDYGSSTMRVIKGSVAQFSDLPQNLDDGYIAYVSSKPGTDGSGHYVKYSASDKAYVECAKPGVLTSLDHATMPHRLVRNADGTFTFEPFAWDTRLVGDDESNPVPSFVGRSINEVFLYRNRLGLLSDENVILSEAGGYFNFFAKSAAAIIDSDPIDVTVASTKVSILRHAVPFNKVLMLFSDQTQFQLSGGDSLSPRTVKADPVTEFVSSPGCRPVGSGAALFFTTDRSGFTGVREYYVDQDTTTNDAADITAHVPAYIPSSPYKMSVSTSDDVLFVLTEAERSAIYGYKFMWGQDEKLQSAWFKFSLSAGDTILGCEFIGTVAYLVVLRGDGLYLETMDLQVESTDTGLPYTVRLDRKVSLTGTYDAPTNTTTWALPWPYASGTTAVLGQAFGPRRGDAVHLTQGTTAYEARASGDYSAGAAFVGVPYTARFRFSEQFVKDRDGVALAAARVQLRRFGISYVDTGYFRLEVTPPGRATMTYEFTGRILGVSGLLLGSPALSTGSHKFPVLSTARGCTIDLVNDSPLPSTFQGAEWDGEVVVPVRR